MAKNYYQVLTVIAPFLKNQRSFAFLCGKSGYLVQQSMRQGIKSPIYLTYLAMGTFSVHDIMAVMVLTQVKVGGETKSIAEWLLGRPAGSIKTIPPQPPSLHTSSSPLILGAAPIVITEQEPQLTNDDILTKIAHDIHVFSAGVPRIVQFLLSNLVSADMMSKFLHGMSPTTVHGLIDVTGEIGMKAQHTSVFSLSPRLLEHPELKAHYTTALIHGIYPNFSLCSVVYTSSLIIISQLQHCLACPL